MSLPSTRSVRGFSLLEVGLAVGVGLLITAAAVAGFRQVRLDAADSFMRSRVSQLQGCVESLYSVEGTFPPIDDYPDSTTPVVRGLRSYWYDHHRADWMVNPYGANFTNPDGQGLSSTWGLRGGPVKVGSQKGNVDASTNNWACSGMMWYYRVVDNNDLPDSAGEITVRDQMRRVNVPCIGYAIAANKAQKLHYFVTSGR